MQSVLDYRLKGRKITTAYQDQGVVYVSHDVVCTWGIVTCLGVLVYLERDGRLVGAAIGHHSTHSINKHRIPTHVENHFNESWQRFISDNPETKNYTGGKILIARCPGVLSRREDVKVAKAMRSFYPGLDVEKTIYRSVVGGSEFGIDLETSDWWTNERKGSLKTEVS